MARPYAGEMMKLAETFGWAAKADIRLLQQAVRMASLSPLRGIGSGGSLTAAHALAGLHQHYTGRLATVGTPLQAVDEPLDSTVSNWLLSAGGGNVDILAAARALILQEPRQLCVLCGREPSPLVRLGRRHPFVDTLVYSVPAGRDGFLATNSLLGFVALLTRAYGAEFGRDGDWHEATQCIEPLIADSSTALEAWVAVTEPLWRRPTTLVLHGSSTLIGAVDLESKFTEAALGNIQLADYRNFAHGRHHWLAKRGATSSVLAFVTKEDRTLAERTLDLLPADIPQARIVIDGDRTVAALASLVAAMRITEWAGQTCGIDPGRPGVPAFGRKLYKLPFPRRRRAADPLSLGRREAAAIARKAGASPANLDALGALDWWRDALKDFLIRLRGASFRGIVLDYDGTLVDTRSRFAPPSPELTAQLVRLAEVGVHIAIATGRGASARRDLRTTLPRELWPHVLVAYYNGAEVATLEENQAPDGSEEVYPTLRPLTEALRSQPELCECTRQENRPFQITLESIRPIAPGRLVDLVRQVVLLAGIDGVNIICSSHSVDVVAPGVSKLNAVRRVREMVGEDPILAIGDQGRWPGNDYELLSVPFALGVDQINVDPSTCWHLGEPGQRGPAVTLEYLSGLEEVAGRVRFAAGSLQ